MASPIPQIIRPEPRRSFETRTSQPQPKPKSSSLLSAQTPDETPSRTQSILNLTSSTLLGIYSPTGYQSDIAELHTPWGTGAETPNTFGAQERYEGYSAPTSPISFSSSPNQIFRRKSVAPPPPAPSTVSMVLSFGLRSVLLFSTGMLYGLLVRHLHDDRQLAPFQVEGILKPRNDWKYLVLWGVSGVALGSLLPWVDGLWAEFEGVAETRQSRQTPEADEGELDSSGLFGADWTPVVRSVGAFVGIAFAIRKLPWTSSLQASLTLFLVNPVLWYIIDRSKTGFLLSSSVGAIGTTLLLFSNSNILPSPKASSYRLNTTSHSHNAINGDDIGGLGRFISRESIEGGIWILSVLFCSCVCFGNVGRRLALSAGPKDREKERKRSRAARAFKGEKRRRR